MSVELYRRCRTLGIDYKSMFPSYVFVTVDAHSTGTHITVRRNDTILYYDSEWTSEAYKFNDKNKPIGVYYPMLSDMFVYIFMHISDTCATKENAIRVEREKEALRELIRKEEIIRYDIECVLKEYSCESSN